MQTHLNYELLFIVSMSLFSLSSSAIWIHSLLDFPFWKTEVEKYATYEVIKPLHLPVQHYVHNHHALSVKSEQQ